MNGNLVFEVIGLFAVTIFVILVIGYLTGFVKINVKINRE